jgi:hypothetical protein
LTCSFCSAAAAETADVRSGHVEVDGLDIMAATLGHEATAPRLRRGLRDRVFSK